MAETPEDVARRIGKEYIESYPTLPPSPELGRVDHAFRVMGRVNRELYDDIPVPVVWTEDDPYDDYADMAETVPAESELRVFSGGDPHPIWNHDAEVIGRAVHDWYGHLHLDVDFSVTGEYRKWEHSRNHYPAFCDRVLFTEVIAQLGAVYYLDDGFADDRFEQRVFASPPEWIEDMARAVERND